ncbi:hypothetical protein SAMN05421860_11721 [Streptomyces microflavus]|nr:hypothetical protein SAMN05421860_11721 [Streptomyces microflavus]
MAMHMEPAPHPYGICCITGAPARSDGTSYSCTRHPKPLRRSPPHLRPAPHPSATHHPARDHPRPCPPPREDGQPFDLTERRRGRHSFAPAPGAGGAPRSSIPSTAGRRRSCGPDHRPAAARHGTTPACCQFNWLWVRRGQCPRASPVAHGEDRSAEAPWSPPPRGDRPPHPHPQRPRLASPDQPGLSPVSLTTAPHSLSAQPARPSAGRAARRGGLILCGLPPGLAENARQEAATCRASTGTGLRAERSDAAVCGGVCCPGAERARGGWGRGTRAWPSGWVCPSRGACRASRAAGRGPAGRRAGPDGEGAGQRRAADASPRRTTCPRRTERCRWGTVGGRRTW